MPVSGGTPTILLTFSGTDGGTPCGNLILSGSTLFGTALQGGVNGDGNIFRVNTDGSNFQNLFSFNGPDGGRPYGLTLSGSTLYGMTINGGTASDGNVFSININGSGFQNLFSFGGTNGSSPIGGLILSGSTLYGGTEFGGSNGDGNIFSINTDGSGFQNLFSFDGGNGKNPVGALTLSGSTLYGVTGLGGTYGDGTVFSLNLNPIPEPSTFLLLTAAALGLLGYAWRKRRRGGAGQRGALMERLTSNRMLLLFAFGVGLWSARALAQTFTTLDYPNGGGTLLYGIDGSNIVGTATFLPGGFLITDRHSRVSSFRREMTQRQSVSLAVLLLAATGTRQTRTTAFSTTDRTIRR